MRSVELLPTRRAVQNKLYYPILARKEHNSGERHSGAGQELQLAATPIYNRCLITCMNLKSLLRAVATMLFLGTLSTALVANAASPDPSSPAAGATTKHKASPDA